MKQFTFLMTITILALFLLFCTAPSAIAKGSFPQSQGAGNFHGSGGSQNQHVSSQPQVAQHPLSNVGGAGGLNSFHGGGAGGWDSFSVQAAGSGGVPEHILPMPPVPPYPNRQQYYPYSLYYGSPYYSATYYGAPSQTTHQSTGVQSYPSPLVIQTSPKPQYYKVTGSAVPGTDFIFVKFNQDGKDVIQKIYTNKETKMVPSDYYVQLNDRITVKYKMSGADCIAVNIKK
jgi:hypothetical protein